LAFTTKIAILTMTQIYHKQHPFLASVKERYSLSKPGSQKKTQHLTLDLRGSGIIYEVGDSLGVFPQHDPDLVNKTLEAIRATGNEFIQSKQSGEFMTLRSFLTSKGNITDISPKLIRTVYNHQLNSVKKHELEQLIDENNREQLKSFLNSHEIWDFLLEHPEVVFSPQEIADLLMPLLPRFYSISSSQRYVGEEVHLTIVPLEYEASGHKRRGVCTHFLCELTELHNPIVPIFIQSAHGFRLPPNLDTPMIMIGPGTGVAPFRAFLQERVLHYQSKAKHWLFFGERHRAYDFFYEEDWAYLGTHGHLRLDLAFSRDQEEKIYVQHRIQENGLEFYQWLEEGAFLYICGDAQQMAKDVELTLQGIIQEYGSKTPLEAKDYIKQLRQQKRYLRDVY
jgi:sulfite reductase (NADPH) flavoprotein alpha-component